MRTLLCNNPNGSIFMRAGVRFLMKSQLYKARESILFSEVKRFGDEE